MKDEIASEVFNSSDDHVLNEHDVNFINTIIKSILLFPKDILVIGLHSFRCFIHSVFINIYMSFVAIFKHSGNFSKQNEPLIKFLI